MGKEMLSGGQFNPVHDFEKDKAIEGVFKDKRAVETKNGKKRQMSNIYTFETDKGLKDVWGSAIIDNAMEKAKIGDRIGIEFIRKDKTKDGSKLNIFEVYKVTA